METQFYFLTKSYYRQFKDPNIMANKESESGRYTVRPFFFAFKDTKQPDIFWIIPISSQVDKFRKIAESKTERYGKCNSICFGKIFGVERAFLIQNMVPVTKKYVRPYIHGGNAIETIDESLSKEIIRNAKDILGLARRGFNILFADVFRIYYELMEEDPNASSRDFANEPNDRATAKEQ